LVTFVLIGRKRFSVECGLVDLEISGSQEGVSGNNVAKLNVDSVTDAEVEGVDSLPLGITLYLCTRCKSGFECLNGISGIPLLIPANKSIHELQDHEHTEVQPIQTDQLNDDGDPNHARHGTPVVAEELQERVNVLLWKRVWTVTLESTLSLSLTQTAFTGIELAHINVPEIWTLFSCC
jgi:hypothetical protein